MKINLGRTPLNLAAGVKLNRLSRKDKKIFIKYLDLAKAELSAYSWMNIYIWQPLFDIHWALIEDNLCVFFRDKLGCFLYLPPLGQKINPQVLEEAFGVMDRFNANPQVSRIENVTQGSLAFYQSLGYESEGKFPEYLCRKSEQVKLAGNRFKSKRALYNYFIKNYEFKYFTFSPRYKSACIEVYDKWASSRRRKYADPVYRGMLDDSRSCLKTLLDDYKSLNCLGRVIEVGGQIKAFTFGFKLNPDTFCILYEVADLSIKGIPQFIFREFCAELKDCKYVNIMDDSGLVNLRGVKQSYCPAKLIPAYIIKRKDDKAYR